ncbi:hypothetical protein D9619_006843 [Psilocybe cf. subviscida]|uniref:DUF6534 domain-containing protein n=1 Tax=Psilocybe cf. subviscida TaxID=2480587 RepID=A0A8H5B4Z4_9AGAR|nr:hypothetical protein D9619_006843 [Psilocybe cf. subviscida]
MSTRPFVLDNTLGAALIGIVVGATLHGVSVVQAWYYYGHQKDPWTIKLLVGAVMAFDTIHQALITHTVYTYTVTYWGSPEELQRLESTGRSHIQRAPLFTSTHIHDKEVILFLVAFLGIYGIARAKFPRNACLAVSPCRIGFLNVVSNRKKFLTGVVALLVLAEFGMILRSNCEGMCTDQLHEIHIQVCVVAFTTMSLHYETFLQLATLKYLSITVNALAAACDVLIAATLCLLLHFSRTGFHRSDTMINKLILFSVNTGFLTSLCAVASLISIVVAGNTFLYIAFFFCIGRLYTNSLLATLNARKMIRVAGNSVHTASGDQLTLSLHEFPKGPAQGRRSSKRNISIKIDTTKEFVTDRDSEQGDQSLDSAHGSSEKKTDVRNSILPWCVQDPTADDSAKS